MKKLLSVVYVLSAIAYQPAQAQVYYREPAGHDQPQYIEYDGARYARIPQNTAYDPQPRYVRLDSEQSNNARLKREVIGTNSLNLHPYLGVEGALGKNKYTEDGDDFLFSKDMRRFGLFGGLQFNQYVGLEGFYHFGKMKDKTHSAEVTEFITLTAKDSLDFSAYGFDLMGYIPIREKIDIILGVGYGWYDFDVKMGLAFYNSTVEKAYKGRLKGKVKDEAVRFSLGTQFLLTDNWSVRLLGRYMDFSDGDAIKSMMELSLGLRYMF